MWLAIVAEVVRRYGSEIELGQHNGVRSCTKQIYRLDLLHANSAKLEAQLRVPSQQ